MGNSHGPRVPLGAGDRNIEAILKRHKYSDIRKIGQGAFGTAFLVRNKRGSKRVCKLMDGFEMSERQLSAAKQEVKLLSGLNHSNIVRYRDHFVEEGCICIIMDHCDGGDLRGVIQQAKMDRRSFREKQVLKWMTQALDALTYIHSKHILHRDLKPDNIFVSANEHLKLGDFGLARVLSHSDDFAKTLCGTPLYLSPELCKSKPYEWSSDIWAMGCILYELCMLKLTFEGNNFDDIARKVCNSPIPSISSDYSDFVQALCTGMLSRNPAGRPSAETALSRIKRSKQESKRQGNKFQSFSSFFSKKDPQKKQKDDFRPVLLGSITPIVESDDDQPPRRKVEGPRVAGRDRGAHGRALQNVDQFCGAVVTPLDWNGDQTPRRKAEGPRYAARSKPDPKPRVGRGVQGRLPTGTMCSYFSESQQKEVRGVFLQSYNECDGTCNLNVKAHVPLCKVWPDPSEPWPRGTLVNYATAPDYVDFPAVVMSVPSRGKYMLDIKDAVAYHKVTLRMW